MIHDNLCVWYTLIHTGQDWQRLAVFALRSLARWLEDRPAEASWLGKRLPVVRAKLGQYNHFAKVTLHPEGDQSPGLNSLLLLLARSRAVAPLRTVLLHNSLATTRHGHIQLEELFLSQVHQLETWRLGSYDKCLRKLALTLLFTVKIKCNKLKTKA